MADSSVQFNGEVGNIESNINKTDIFDLNLSKSASKQKYPSMECLKDLIDQIFPVGIILSFDTDVDPNELYGGTWVRIKGRFIWSVGDGETAGTVGGEKTHTLTINEMPTHSHEPDMWAQVMSPGGDTGSYGAVGTKIGSYRDYEDKQNYRTSSVGGNQPHNNMPPYYGANTWRRIE